MKRPIDTRESRNEPQIMERGSERKALCQDCFQCQLCSKRRCSLCRQVIHTNGPPELGTCFTYGQYMDRKKRKSMNCVPVIDMYECSDCGTCVELCPSVFERNEDAGFIEVKELPYYLQEDIQEAISCCPKDCIALEEIIA